jgi:hypothetical protein
MKNLILIFAALALSSVGCSQDNSSRVIEGILEDSRSTTGSVARVVEGTAVESEEDGQWIYRTKDPLLAVEISSTE